MHFTTFLQYKKLLTIHDVLVINLVFFLIKYNTFLLCASNSKYDGMPRGYTMKQIDIDNVDSFSTVKFIYFLKGCKLSGSSFRIIRSHLEIRCNWL